VSASTDYPDIFYHRTTEESWELIQAERILWGKPWMKYNGKGSYRYTYMAPVDWGDGYGPVLLEVRYKPTGVGVKIAGKAIDNYGFDPPPGEICTQFSVFVPIPLENVRRIDPSEVRPLSPLEIGKPTV
jgi:hypothetical protein